MSRETPDRSPMVKYPILIFVCNGFWCPMWFSTIKKLFYHCYTVLSSFFISSFMLAQFIDTLLNKTITGFVNNCITLMPTINALCKALNLLAKRQRIIKLMYSLDNEKFRSQNCRETKVLKKYRRLSRFISAVITVNTLVTLEFMVFGPIIKNPQLRRLPFGAWIPYDTNTEFSFWLTLMWEKISASAVGLANLANDVLSISIMMHISGQLDILSDRLINLADDNSEDIFERPFDEVYNHEDLARDKRIRDKFVDCLHHHILIFQLADELQECFVWTFASQMLVSLTGTCTGAFQLARSSIGNSEFTTAALFIGCMISEAFLYCWFGNEVHLKSLEIRNSAYKMNWVSLGVNRQKDILNVCMRSKQPILFTSGPAMPLSNEFFVNILQASYTAFTVLREISVDSSSPSVLQIENEHSEVQM